MLNDVYPAWYLLVGSENNVMIRPWVSGCLVYSSADSSVLASFDVRLDKKKRPTVRGLQRMVEEERYCADIMTQIASVHEALRGVLSVRRPNRIHGGRQRPRPAEQRPNNSTETAGHVAVLFVGQRGRALSLRVRDAGRYNRRRVARTRHRQRFGVSSSATAGYSSGVSSTRGAVRESQPPREQAARLRPSGQAVRARGADAGMLLVRLAPNLFRYAAPDANPERLQFDTMVGGQAWRLRLSSANDGPLALSLGGPPGAAAFIRAELDLPRA